jgi:hypothetical protein
MTIRSVALFFLLALAALLPSCASSDKSNDGSGVSSIPWNRPENWESQGPMGGMMQQGR